MPHYQKPPELYDGLIPYSMFIAIPMLQPGGWMGHNLASANRSLVARRSDDRVPQRGAGKVAPEDLARAEQWRGAVPPFERGSRVQASPGLAGGRKV